MLTLPVSLFVALFLAIILIRLYRSDQKAVSLIVFTGLCMAQAILVSLNLHYGIHALRPLQIVNASIIPTMGVIAFQHSMLRPPKIKRDIPYLIVPALTVMIYSIYPAALDVYLIGIYAAAAFYIVIFLWRYRARFPRPNLAQDQLPLWVWGAIAAAFILSALTDTLIALTYIVDVSLPLEMIVSIFVSMNLLVMGTAAAFMGAPPKDTADPSAQTHPAPQTDPDNLRDVASRLDRLMEDEKAYLDPELTLARLARKLNIPAKQLSIAVNTLKGESISRYINAHRIEYACTLLSTGTPVTHAMLESGFNTKSNFNREFLRVKGMTPRDWRAAQVTETA